MRTHDDGVRRRALSAVVIAALAAGVGLGVASFDGLDTLRLRSVDTRFAVRGSDGPSERIVLVGIDDESLAVLPRWPFSRTRHASVLRRLDAAGARLIVYDIDFDRPSSDEDADFALYDAAAAARPVVFATTGIRADGTTQVLGGDANLRAIGARAAAALLPRDSDGVVRHLTPAVKGLPTLASAVAGRPSRGWIDFRGPAGTLDALSFVDVLNGRFDRAAVRGRIVVVGATAPVIHDQHPTAVDGAMSGAELQANAIDTALRGRPLDDAPGWVATLSILALALLAPLAGLRFGTLAIAAIGGAATLAWLVAGQLTFNGGTVLDVVSPLLALAVGLTATAGRQAIVERRERESLRRAFASFHPLLIDRVLAGDKGSLLGPEDIIGGYRLEEVIGQGGMGVVYRGVQLTLDRVEAVKLINAQYAADPGYRERFVRESRIAARIEHPHVVPVYNAGADRGLLYIAMRMIDGVTLHDAVRAQGPLKPGDAVRVIAQLAQALSAAHALGLVHRDVKPANVLLAGETAPHVYLTDFGIAHDIREGDGGARAIVGSPEYLAPEQLDGGEIGPWTDVYALAGVLVFCLTGAPPFPRDSTQEMLAARGEKPPRLSTLRPELGDALDDVLERSLAADRKVRPQTALAFVAAVAQAAGGLKDDIDIGAGAATDAGHAPVAQRDVGAGEVTLGPG